MLLQASEYSELRTHFETASTVFSPSRLIETIIETLPKRRHHPRLEAPAVRHDSVDLRISLVFSNSISVPDSYVQISPDSSPCQSPAAPADSPPERSS